MKGSPCPTIALGIIYCINLLLLLLLFIDEISLTDPDDILDRFVNQQRQETPVHKPRKGTSISAPARDERPPSVNTVDTELWLRPGTGPAGT